MFFLHFNLWIYLKYVLIIIISCILVIWIVKKMIKSGQRKLAFYFAQIKVVVRCFGTEVNS